MKKKRLLTIATILMLLFSNIISLNAAWIYTDWETNLDFVVVNRKARIVAYRGDDGILTIPSSLTYGGGYSVFGIESAAFDYCDNITNLKGGYYNMIIMSSAFKGSTSLKNVDFKVQEIENYAFSDCCALENVKLKSVKIISTKAFNNCVKLSEITLDKTITQIGENAFSGCNSLIDVYYNGTLEEKNAIIIGVGNESLINAKWHFEICENNGHTYDGECDAECEVCGEKKNITHEWNAGEITKKSTCKENGIKTYSCNNCSETKEELIEKNNNHTFASWNIAKTPSCTENGIEARACSICKKEETRDISATGHTLGKWETKKYATCVSKGEQVKKCSKCSYSETREIAANGHFLNGWQIIENETCTKTGLQLRNCNNCTYFETKIINAKGHNYSKEWTTDTAATCVTTGIKSYHCLYCDSKTSLTNISPIGHTFGEWKIIKEATTKTTGEAQRKCVNTGCSEKELKTIAKLAEDGHTHKFGAWETKEKATCTNNGENIRKCTICSEIETVVISSKGHSFNEWQIVKQVTCVENGKITRLCKNCNKNESEVILTTGHKFGEAVIIKEATETEIGVKKYTCTICNKTKEEEIPLISSKPKDENNDIKTNENNVTKEKNNIIWIIPAIVVMICVLSVIIAINTKKKI